MVAMITPKQLAELRQSGAKVELIDVRTPVEYREVHVDSAQNVPLDQLDPAAVMQARNGSSNEPLYVICRSGSRGQQACEKFLKAGFTNVVNVEGGHAGLGPSWLAGRSRLESDFAGAASAHRSRVAGRYGFGAWLLRESVLDLSRGLRRCGTDLCRNHRHLCDGDDAGEDAVESSAQGTDQGVR